MVNATATKLLDTKGVYGLGDVVHISFNDETVLARIIYVDTIGVSVVLTDYKTWYDYDREHRSQSGTYRIPKSIEASTFHPWHQVITLQPIMESATYEAWVATREAAA